MLGYRYLQPFEGIREMRFFISYSHNMSAEASFVKLLCTELQSAGHEVFVYTEISIGTNWVQEIISRIEWCEGFIVILSTASLASEMVQAEIRRAHDRHKRCGLPKILPVRMRYSTQLDPELDAILGRLQHFKWKGSEDSPSVLAQLLATASGRSPEIGGSTYLNSHQPESFSNDLRRPQPAARSLMFSAPGGTIRVNDPFYIERDADSLVARRAHLMGETIVIKAPRQLGKSSLLLRYLDGCNKQDKRTTILDFSIFTEAELEDYTALLSGIASFLFREFKSAALSPPRIEKQRDLTNFVQDEILSVSPGGIVFAFDEVDRVMGHRYQKDFFTMLRLWHNKRAEPLSPWEKLDLALVISTEPYLLIDAADRSPFNVTPPVELLPFSVEHCLKLNEKYGTPLEPSEIKKLHEILGGHPYLTRLALYHFTTQEALDFQSLIERALSGLDPFSDHLQALLMKLERQPDLIDALRYISARQGNLKRDLYFRLYGAGLIRQDHGRAIFSNLLYERFFHMVL